MNIFFLHKDPKIAACMQCDKHVVKMVLETAQMLSTAARAQGYDMGYKSAYPNHPMTLWVNESPHNYTWAAIHGLELAHEYTRRYKKRHKSQDIIEPLWDLKKGISTKCTTPPLCMPDEYKTENYVQSYRNYYYFEKKSFAKYTNSVIPTFMKGEEYLKEISK
jgi:hypothetical protein